MRNEVYEYLTANALSVSEIAAAMEVSRDAVYKFFNSGATRTTTYSRYAKALTELGAPIDWRELRKMITGEDDEGGEEDGKALDEEGGSRHDGR